MFADTKNEDEFICRANGKLLITAEYFVLDGAEALAVPTKLGQTLRAKRLSSKSSLLYWIALNSEHKPWLQLTFDIKIIVCIEGEGEVSERLTTILRKARLLNPAFLTDGYDYVVETHLEFPNNWGLGSSSTLIYCLAKWAEVNAYELLWNTLGGSGYDVACAGSHSPILYSIKNSCPQVLQTQWRPPFHEQIYFAHLGHKQSSAEGILQYRKNTSDKGAVIYSLNQITEQVLACSHFEMFETLLNEHERLVGSYMGMITVKEAHFSNYWGTVKSLGAWGGDFVLITNNRSRDELQTYLHSNGIDTLFSWNDIILSNNN